MILLQGRDLIQSLTGGDVAELHNKLCPLGYTRPPIRALLFRDQWLRIQRPGRRQQHPLLRPGRAGGRNAASRRDMGKDGLHGVAPGNVGPQRHRPDRRSARGRRCRRVFSESDAGRLVSPRGGRRASAGHSGRTPKRRPPSRPPRPKPRRTPRLPPSRMPSRWAAHALRSSTTAEAPGTPRAPRATAKASRWRYSTLSAGARKSTCCVRRSRAAAFSMSRASTWPARRSTTSMPTPARQNSWHNLGLILRHRLSLD